MTSFVTIPEIKDFLSIRPSNVDEDGRLANIAVQVSSLVESYCNRKFYAENYLEYFDGGQAAVFIDNPPILKIYEVSQFDGNSYMFLGGPGTSGEPIAIEGSSHTISVTNNAVLNSRSKKFNKSSLKLDGASSIYTEPSTDWDFGADSFTVEGFTRFNSNTGVQTICSCGSNSNTNWSFGVDFSTSGLFFTSIENDVENVHIETSNTEFNVNKFYHFAVVRDENGFKLFQEGNLLSSISTSNSVCNPTSSLYIGSFLNSSNYLSGFIDNFHVSHSSKYNSSFETSQFPVVADHSTKLLLNFDGDNNSTYIVDLSRKVNEYTFYPSTGEVNFNAGLGAGTEKLSFFSPSKSLNYPNGIKVQYRGGFEDIPADLKMAVLELIKVVYKGKSGTERQSLQGETSVSFKLSTDDFPPQVKRVLNLYRLIS